MLAGTLPTVPELVPLTAAPGSCRNTAFHELMLKKNEQIYKLLAICIAMCASVERWLDDAVKENLRKKCADDLQQMQGGSMEHFKKVFSYGCPKFVTALPPDLSEERVDNSLAGFHAARQRFMAEVRSRFAPPLRLGCLRAPSDVAARCRGAPDTLRPLSMVLPAVLMICPCVTSQAAANPPQGFAPARLVTSGRQGADVAGAAACRRRRRTSFRT